MNIFFTRKHSLSSTFGIGTFCKAQHHSSQYFETKPVRNRQRIQAKPQQPTHMFSPWSQLSHQHLIVFSPSSPSPPTTRRNHCYSALQPTAHTHTRLRLYTLALSLLVNSTFFGHPATYNHCTCAASFHILSCSGGWCPLYLTARMCLRLLLFRKGSFPMLLGSGLR